ncbi:MAG: PQQ-binding-like beta-propeller repeat protein, partial [Chloroflexi bacterium]|nr:PQQ-binding-like beta-propeller repeat protein [Chloroflexota bacterium]
MGVFTLLWISVGFFSCVPTPDAAAMAAAEMTGLRQGAVAADLAQDDPTGVPGGDGSAAASAEADSSEWFMAGANAQRTSWVASTSSNVTEIRGRVTPVWYRPIDAYVHGKTQVIVHAGRLYISTARGLYALSAETGALEWVFPTELPLGHSPTVVNDVVFVGGLDHRLYALAATPDLAALPVDASTGYRINDRVLWAFEGEAGFETNPLVMDGTVFAGN